MNRVCALYSLTSDTMLEKQIDLINDVDNLNEDDFYYLVRSKFSSYLSSTGHVDRILKILFFDPETDILGTEDNVNKIVMKWNIKGVTEYAPVSLTLLTKIL